MIFEVFLMLFTGLIAGLLSGLFGLGGGIIVVPILYVFFMHLGVQDSMVMHLAIGTSLAAMITTTFNSIWMHQRKKNIDWSLVFWLLPYVALGAVFGAMISHFIQSQFLRYFFAAFLVFIILNALLKKNFTDQYQLKDFDFPKNNIAKIFFTGVGLLGVLLGVGGSLFSVPYFRRFHCPMKRASALALALTPAVSLVGAVGYLIIGLQSRSVFPYAIGFVYWPAFIGIGLGSLLGVPIGVHLAHKMHDKHQAKLYIVLLFIFLAMILY